MAYWRFDAIANSWSSLGNFLKSINLSSKVSSKRRTCFKNVSKLKLYRLIFHKQVASSFWNTETVSTGLSDFHKLALTVLNTIIF